MFSHDGDLPTDFFLFRDGPVLVMTDEELWKLGTRWLEEKRGYRVHRWALKSEDAFHREVSETFCWRVQFGYSPWNGNMAAFNDGATSWQLPDGSRVVIAIENAQKLKRWFGGQAPDFWNILHSASRMQLLFGVRMLVVANTTAKGEAERWAKAPGVIHLTRKMFPGGALANEVGLPRY